jgi:phage terminase large subunit GpA-like protein
MKLTSDSYKRSASSYYKDNEKKSRINLRRYTRHHYDLLEKVRASTNLEKEWDDANNFRWLHQATKLLAPPPVLSISQWADLYRQISTEFAAEPGQWHTDKFEAMREVMDACSPTSKFRRVVLVKPTQSGGTEACVLNVIGYTIDINPRSILVVFPTLDATGSFSKERLDPMIDVTPSLKERVLEGSSNRVTTGSKATTVFKKKYPGGFLNMVGSNSTTGLSSRPVPIVIIDEVDLCIRNANRQGNPVKLALARTTTFFDRKEILLSSPSADEGESGIIPFWEEGSKAKLEHRCPNEQCGHWQVLDFDRMDIETATLACELCGQYFPQWKWLVTHRWIHELPEHGTIASFWMTGLDSPWLDWKVDLCDDYVNCKKMEDMGDDSLMRVFVNSKLAKYFKKKGKRIEADLYHERREIYPCHLAKAEVPDNVVLITAGVDVQDSYIVYDVRGWAKGRESWGIETGEFQGDPAKEEEVWKQLDEFVYRRVWRYANGMYIRTRLMFVDCQGHKTDAVYKYCKPRHPRCFAIKGIGGPNPIIIGGKRREKGEGAWRVNLGVDTLKDEFHSRLSVERPGPGYCHWPMANNGMPCCGYTLEYFEEIISEQREITYNKSGFATSKWTKNRTDANEALDVNVYARAALEYLKVKLEQMPKDIANKLSKEDVEVFEIGDKAIHVVKEKPKHGQATTNRPGQNVHTTNIFGQQEEASSIAGPAAAVRARSSYGAGSNTSF